MSATTSVRPGVEGVQLDLRPVTATIGAEVVDLDLAGPLDEATASALLDALQQWRVLFFRNQHVGHAEHVALANQLGGAVYTHPFDDRPAPATYPPEIHVDGHPEIYTIDHRWAQAKRVERERTTGQSGYDNSYAGAHVDSGALVNPPSISILRAEVVPPFGGDTTWFNSVAAYEGLSEPIRRFVDTLWAEHKFGSDYDSYLDPTIAEYRISHHPVARHIPETGERSLFVTPVFTTRILDVTPDESRWILDRLFAELVRPGYGVRFKWEPGDVAISDNRTTVHVGPQDLADDVHRIMHLTEVEGAVPIAVDGRRSVQIEGTSRRRSKLASDDSKRLQ